MKLDLGCGRRKKEGFVGVDQYAMDGVDVVMNIGTEAWPWPDNSVEEINCSHFFEHLTQDERVHVMNEAYRVMKPGSKFLNITPHWASGRSYGDVTHKWPAVSEMFYYYVKKAWRDENAPHTDIQWNAKGFSCDFDVTWGYSFSEEVASRNPEYIQFALTYFKDAAQDLHATLVKPVPKEE